MKDKKTNPYIKPISWALAFILLGVFLTKIYEITNAKDFIGDMSDCFMLPGVLISGVAGISWAGKFGTFDMISYGTKSFFGIFIPPLSRDLPTHFYDYRKQKEEKGRQWLRHSLQVGLACLALSIILLIVYLIL